MELVISFQKRLQVPVLFSPGHRDGGHDQRVPALGERQGHHPPQGPTHAVPQQLVLCLTQVSTGGLYLQCLPSRRRCSA